MTSDKLIVDWFRYKSPLLILKGLGKRVMDIDWHKNHGLYHAYLVFQFSNTKDEDGGGRGVVRSDAEEGDEAEGN